MNKNYAPGEAGFHKANKTPGRGVFGFKTVANRCFWCRQKMAASPRGYLGLKVSQHGQELFERKLIGVIHKVCPKTEPPTLGEVE